MRWCVPPYTGVVKRNDSPGPQVERNTVEIAAIPELNTAAAAAPFSSGTI